MTLEEFEEQVHLLVWGSEELEISCGDEDTQQRVLDAYADKCAETTWQPIETAPKDGSEFLAVDARAGDGFWQVVYFDEDVTTPFCMRVSDAAVAYQKGFFTHWMPLPPPPAGEDG